MKAIKQHVLFIFVLILLLFNASDSNANSADIEATIWQCFDQGYYTHEESVKALTHAEVHNLIPIANTPLVVLCPSILSELKIKE